MKKILLWSLFLSSVLINSQVYAWTITNTGPGTCRVNWGGGGSTKGILCPDGGIGTPQSPHVQSCCIHGETCSTASGCYAGIVEESFPEAGSATSLNLPETSTLPNSEPASAEIPAPLLPK